MIAQPTFFPWLGYFDMISQVDKFVILDDVNFDYQSWQHRNNFKTSTGLKLFTVPVKKGNKKDKILDIEIANPAFTYKKLIKFCSSNYNKSKYYKNYEKDLLFTLQKGFASKSLIKLNVGIIKWFLKILNINTSVVYSSQMKLNSNKTFKIIDICKNLNANEYISTIGSKNYLENHKNLFINEKILLTYHRYKHPKYNQLFKPFVEYACILDLILNEGQKSHKIINSGRL